MTWMGRGLIGVTAALAGCAGDDGAADATTATSPTSNADSSGEVTGSTAADPTPGATSDGSSGGATDATGETSGGSSGGNADCAPGEKPGPAGISDGLVSTAGVAVNVRTPDNYDSTVQHPLLIVFAPAGADAFATEGFTGLTPDALALGYIIVFVDHVSPQSTDVIEGLEPILDDVVGEWCVDEERIFYTGHSDGGTIANVLMVTDDEGPQPTSAAPSAAGVTGTTATQIGCPSEPRSFMVIHSSNDTLFAPADGFGYDVAEAWAGCNDCAPGTTDEGACIRWSGCADGVVVLFCETAGAHGQWPGLNTEMFAFFAETSP